MKAQKFHLGHLLSIYTGRNFSVDGKSGVFSFLDYMTGRVNSQFERDMARATAKAALEKQFPWIKDAAAHCEADWEVGNITKTMEGKSMPLPLAQANAG